MGMKAKKHAFLVSVLGAERTEALLDFLPVMEARLEEAGIGWKEVAALEVEALRAVCQGPSCATASKGDGEEAVVEVVDVAPAPLGGATSFAEADDYMRAQEQDAMIHDQEYVFRTIFDNVMAGDDAMNAKVARIERASVELAARLRPPVGEKTAAIGQKQVAGSPAQPYVDDLAGGGQDVKALGEAGEKAAQLEASGDPAAPYISELLLQGATGPG